MYDAETAFKKALTNASLSQKDVFKDNKLDLKLLKSCTTPHSVTLTYSNVAKYNESLTANNYPMVTLYGFTNYLDLYTWVVSGQTGIKKTINRYGEDMDVFVPVHKDTMKKPLPKENGRPTDEGTDTIADSSYTWGTLGASLGHVDPQAVQSIKDHSVKTMGQAVGDDYVYLNQNGKTIAVMPFNVQKNRLDVVGLVELVDTSIANPANNTAKNDDTADLLIANAIIQLGIENSLDIKFSNDLKDNPLFQRLKDGKGILKIKTLKEDDQ